MTDKKVDKILMEHLFETKIYPSYEFQMLMKIRRTEGRMLPAAVWGASLVCGTAFIKLSQLSFKMSYYLLLSELHHFSVEQLSLSCHSCHTSCHITCCCLRCITCLWNSWSCCSRAATAESVLMAPLAVLCACAWAPPPGPGGGGSPLFICKYLICNHNNCKISLSIESWAQEIFHVTVL